MKFLYTHHGLAAFWSWGGGQAGGKREMLGMYSLWTCCSTKCSGGFDPRDAGPVEGPAAVALEHPGDRCILPLRA